MDEARYVVFHIDMLQPTEQIAKRLEMNCPAHMHIVAILPSFNGGSMVRVFCEQR